MTPQEAIALLGQATEPQMAGRITRDGYVKLAEALATLGALAKQADAAFAQVKSSEPCPEREK